MTKLEDTLKLHELDQAIFLDVADQLQDEIKDVATFMKLSHLQSLIFGIVTRLTMVSRKTNLFICHCHMYTNF